MEINKKHLIAYSILGVLVALFFGITMHQCSNPKIEYITSPPERIHDTIIRDSIQIQEKVKWKYRTKYDTTLLVFRDTIHDTILIEIPIDHYQYRDTGSTDSTKYTLGINYSGFKPTLDSVWFNYSYTPQTIVKTKRNGWGQFVGVGIGVGANATVVGNTVYAGPGVSLNIVYGFGYHF